MPTIVASKFGSTLSTHSTRFGRFGGFGGSGGFGGFGRFDGFGLSGLSPPPSHPFPRQVVCGVIFKWFCMCFACGLHMCGRAQDSNLRAPPPLPRDPARLAPSCPPPPPLAGRRWARGERRAGRVWRERGRAAPRPRQGPRTQRERCVGCICVSCALCRVFFIVCSSLCVCAQRLRACVFGVSHCSDARGERGSVRGDLGDLHP